MTALPSTPIVAVAIIVAKTKETAETRSRLRAICPCSRARWRFCGRAGKIFSSRLAIEPAQGLQRHRGPGARDTGGEAGRVERQEDQASQHDRGGRGDENVHLRSESGDDALGNCEDEERSEQREAELEGEDKDATAEFDHEVRSR